MNRIDVIEDNEIPIKDATLDLESSANLPWREYLKVKGLEQESVESLEDMCKKCIKKQMTDHGSIKIKCTGLVGARNHLGSEVYDELAPRLDSDTLEGMEMIYNPITWIENMIVDDNPSKKMFDPRWYQTRILNCSASRKVLRMGRRCIDGDEKVRGKKKNYSVKHLFHLAKHHKKLPEIFTYNMETMEEEYTSKYYLVPNPETTLIEFTFEDSTTLKVTREHPVLIYKDKQYYFEEAINIRAEDTTVRVDNTFLKVLSRRVVRNRQTYHMTVVGTHTFATSNGVIQHNTGKALDIKTPIPTPKGWSTMEHLKVGDKVYDDNGEECNVTFATEIQYDRKCYELEFDNGTTLIADEDHQWNISTSTKSEFTTTTKRLLEIEEDKYIRVANAIDKKTRESRESNLINLVKVFGEIVGDYYILPYQIDDTDVKELVLRLGIKVYKHSLSHFKIKTLKHNEEKLKIISIRNVKTRPVKCISVDSPNNLYLAGSDYIVTHNTASMTVGLLHRLLTNTDYKVLMVAPMQTMIDEVYDTIKKYCDKMEGKKILNSRTTPIHEVLFDTGSTFKGVTAGAQGAKGTRGKGADLIYVDECLTEFARITMSDGKTKAIVDVDEGDYVQSYDTEEERYVPKRVITVRCTGVKEVFKYRTISGKTITATANHPVLTSEGWKPISKAKDIAVPHKKIYGVFFETMLGGVRKGLQKVYNLTVEGTHVYIADNFIVHNCDFLGTKDMTSIVAILADTLNTEFWASSTPMGERNLYKLAQNPRYKEFHYPTYVSPTYTDETDDDFRSEMDSTGIIQEVLAEFGADDNMAFQLHFIEACILDSEKEIDVESVLANRKAYDIAIGCDWNKAKVGTRILVVAREKASKKLLIVEKHRISAADRTQPVAVQAIKDLNRKWFADFIYVDEGHGEAQGADLREEGAQALRFKDPNNPDIRLLDVQSIQFGSSLTIKDNITGKEFRKQTKNFMVENLAKVLQSNGIILQESLDMNIIAQLKNYAIKSQSISGLRVYEPREKVKIGDHDLDALLLAAFAFKMNLDDGYGSGVSFTPIVNSKESVGFTTQSIEKRDLIEASGQVIVNKNSTRRAGGRKAFKARSRWQ